MLRPQLPVDLLQLSLNFAGALQATTPAGEHGSSFTNALRDFLNMSGMKSSILFGLLAGLFAWQRLRVMGWWRSWTSDDIHFWNLVPLGTSKRRRVRVLLEAVNRGAVDRAAEYSGVSVAGRSGGGRHLGQRFSRATKALRPAKYSPGKATAAWKVFFEEFWAPQRAYIIPGCHAFTGSEDFWADDAVSVVRGWLESSSGESTSSKIWISAAGGAGKTTFMHRLFLDLIGAVESHPPLSGPVPMLASANNLKPYTDQIAALKTGDDACTVFSDIWLKNRGIQVPEYLRKSLLASFSEELKNGQILLLFDGYDELSYMDLGTFPSRLIDQVRRCVVAQRADHTAVATQKDRSVSLEDAWSSAQIAEHIALRWPQWPEERGIVTTVIAEVLERHDAIERDHRHRASHWLSQPRNLDLFLNDLVPDAKERSTERPKLPDERELRRRAESQPYLFDRIVGRAIARVADPTAKETEIRQRLFSIAINDPTDPRRRMLARPVELGDVTGRHVSALSELLGLSPGDPGVSPDRLYFRHAALREYFIAGRIAWEIHETARDADPGDELVRFAGDAWDSTKRQAIADWLNRLDRHHDSVRAREHRVTLVRDRLPRRGSGGQPVHPNMLRNLLELMIGLELGLEADHSTGAAKRQRSEIELQDLDLSTLAGDHIDLKSMTVNNCSFDKAQLVAAQLTYARFTSCSFRGANLSRADALGARFDDCDFGTGGEDPAIVEQMVIDEKAFPPDVSAELLEKGALKERSRYVNEFGEQFSKKQPAFLGGGLERLENGAYLPAIEQAVRDWEKVAPGQPVYLVDLMAGGSYERVTALLDKFDNLHILGIDRDPSKRPTTPRFEWRCVDIGRRGLDGTFELGLDLGSNLGEAFPASTGKAHVVVAKKALHELDYELQPALIHEVADSLTPGGRFILFADTPGSSDGAVDLAKLKGVHDELESLRSRLSDGSTLMRGGSDAGGSPAQPTEVAALLEDRDYDATPIGQIRFSNTWIMIKDWANQNRHERDHRYFASVPEILDWARPWFGEPAAVELNKYRLNPLIFNEQGIQRVLKYLNAEVRAGHDKRRAVLDNRAQLLEWISEGDAFRVLVDFTKSKLRKDAPLAVALQAQPEEVALERIDPALAALDSGEKAPAFDLPCAVLVFEKPR